MVRQEDYREFETTLSNREFQGGCGSKSDPVSNQIRQAGRGVGIELGGRHSAQPV